MIIYIILYTPPCYKVIVNKYESSSILYSTIQWDDAHTKSMDTCYYTVRRDELYSYSYSPSYVIGYR